MTYIIAKFTAAKFSCATTQFKNEFDLYGAEFS
jgi:hypothetical protein